MGAWACSDDATLALDIEIDDEGPLVTPHDQAAPERPRRYGPQAPELTGEADLMLMNDKHDWGKGPAYFFQRNFDKLVVIRERDFNDTAETKQRRWDVSSDRHRSLHDSERTVTDDDDDLVQPGQKPWYCFWNGTILEGFLYINQSVTPGNDSGVEVPAAATSTAVDYFHSPIPSGMAAPSPADPSSSVGKRNQVDLADFTKVVKIEERRHPGAPAPYCQQFQMLANGRMGLVTYPRSQELVKVRLPEVEPTEQKSVRNWKRVLSRGRDPRRPKKRGNSQQGCQCQWVVG